VERSAWDKRSSLLSPLVEHEEKKFYSACPEFLVLNEKEAAE
jgi:hypothetical protein